MLYRIPPDRNGSKVCNVFDYVVKDMGDGSKQTFGEIRLVEIAPFPVKIWTLKN